MGLTVIILLFLMTDELLGAPNQTSSLLDVIVTHMTSSPQPSSGRQQVYTSQESGGSGLIASTSLDSLKNTTSSSHVYSEFSGETNTDFSSPTYSGEPFTTKGDSTTAIMTRDHVNFHPLVFSTPTMEGEFNTPTIEGEFNTLTVEAEFSTRTVEAEFSTPTMEGQFSTHTVEDEVSTRTVEDEFNTKTVEGELSTPTVEDEVSTSTVDDEFNTQTVEGELSTPTVEGELSTPTVEGEVSTRTVEAEFSTHTMEGEFNIQTVDGEFSTPTSESQFSIPNMHGEFNIVIVEAEFSFTTEWEDLASGYTKCNDSESLRQGCRNGGECVTRMDGEERRTMCKCGTNFTGEKCFSKFNVLFFESLIPIPTMYWLPWCIGLPLVLAVVILIIICCKKHPRCSPKHPAVSTDPENGPGTYSGFASQSSNYIGCSNGEVTNGSYHLSRNGHGSNGLSTFSPPKPVDNNNDSITSL